MDKILRYCADLGHYLSDAHVPLHTTENYNGQLTGQRGIHALWESRIPELLSDTFDFLVGRAPYINNIKSKIWSIIYNSYGEVGPVLTKEKKVTSNFQADQKYTVKSKSGGSKKDYSEAFVRSYAAALDGMVEERMRMSVLSVGQFWYTAWVNAGQPDLSQLMDVEAKEKSR